MYGCDVDNFDYKSSVDYYMPFVNQRGNTYAIRDLFSVAYLMDPTHRAKCYKDPNYYILDFKCGETNNKEALRWNYKDMQRGYQIKDKVKYFFKDCLKQNAVIKIDLCYS